MAEEAWQLVSRSDSWEVTSSITKAKQGEKTAGGASL